MLFKLIDVYILACVGMLSVWSPDPEPSLLEHTLTPYAGLQVLKCLCAYCAVCVRVVILSGFTDPVTALPIPGPASHNVNPMQYRLHNAVVL